MKKANSETRLTVTFSDNAYGNEGEKITASCGMLNTLCCFCGEAVDHYKALGLYGLAGEAQQIHDEIHEALEKHGLYDDI